jgi:dynein heavy chain
MQAAVLCCVVAILQDIAVFEAIISDLFPDTQLPEPDNLQLTAALTAACWESGLQPEPAFIRKALQLHYTLGVRFGVMLVGPAGGGKTACYRSLQAAQTAILQLSPQHGKRSAAAAPAPADADTPSDQGTDAPTFVGVQAHVLNPKSVNLAEMYGSVNAVTNEWTDGLASRMIRAAVADVSSNVHWVVFDGPVDAGWVESMNTGEAQALGLGPTTEQG